MPDEHYENPKLAAIYDGFCGWGRDRDFYLALAGDPPQHILDLGCGTGLLCEAYAALGHRVTGADPTATLATMRRHLTPSGRAVFESRNPAVDWAAEWNGTEELSVAGQTIGYTTEVLSWVGDRVSFEQRFAFPDEILVSFSELRFLPKEAIEARLAAAGLTVEALFGDWDRSPFDPTSSHEMIFVARPVER